MRQAGLPIPSMGSEAPFQGAGGSADGVDGATPGASNWLTSPLRSTGPSLERFGYRVLETPDQFGLLIG